MDARGRTLIALVTAALAACSLAFPLDRFEAGKPAPDAGPDAPLDAAADAGDAGPDAQPPGCALRHVPPPPAADDPGGADADVVFAVRSMQAQLDGGALPGLDLDDACTCPDPSSCVAKRAVCDGDGGVDDQVGAILGNTLAFGTLDPATFNGYIAHGQSTMLFVVKGYNGTPNDTKVEVAIVGANGRYPPDAGDIAPPLWDGNDVWTFMRQTVLTADPFVPKLQDLSAYVAGGVLVVHGGEPIGGAPTSAPFLGVLFHLQSAVVAARIVSEGGRFALRDGVFTGRLPTSSLLVALSALLDPADQTKFLCGSDPTYQSIKQTLCQSPDIAASPADDGRGAPCNALSVAAAFEAEEAKRGDVGVDPVVPTGCDAGYTDDCP